MQKEIITPTTNEYLLKIPKKYINKRIEIIISPVNKEESLDTDIFEKTKGILANKNIDPLKWQKQIRDEWE